MDYIRMLFKKKLNKKGITLVEVVITLAVVSVITPIMFAVFSYGVDIFYSYGRYLKQQDNATYVINHLKGDIKNAYQFKVEDDKLLLKYSDDTQSIWFFEDDSLKFEDSDGNEHAVVGNIKTDESSISYNSSSEIIKIEIQPVKGNTGRFTSRNFNKPIITEFSVKYKESI